MPRICVVTGSRAEYGLLYWLLKAIDGDPRLELQVVVTGPHLSPAFGNTITTIERDGFQPVARVECLMSSDSAVGVSKSVALALSGFADLFAWLAPDAVVVLGDRFEVFAAAQAAYLARVPIAHVAGGDVTEGSLDDGMRHMITKMATLHFVTHAAAARRVQQLGEEPAHVFNVGHLGLDAIRRLVPMSRGELAASMGYQFRTRNLLVTFHPATLEEESPESQFGELAAALRELGDEVGMVFTQPNADPGGHTIDGALRELVRDLSPRAVLVETLGQRRYLSLLREVDAVVGNSSSGVLEAPFSGVATVNIGERQTGRPQAASVISCRARRQDILTGIKRAFEIRCDNVENPFGDGHAAERIVDVLAERLPSLRGTKKRFIDLTM